MDDVSAGFITQGAKCANRSFPSFSQNSEDCCKCLKLERLSENPARKIHLRASRVAYAAVFFNAVGAMTLPETRPARCACRNAYNRCRRTFLMARPANSKTPLVRGGERLSD